MIGNEKFLRDLFRHNDEYDYSYARKGPSESETAAHLSKKILQSQINLKIDRDFPF